MKPVLNVTQLEILLELALKTSKSDFSNYRWIVDPLDGSLNFARHIDFLHINSFLERYGTFVGGSL